MIKINENQILEMVKNNDIKNIEKYVKLEIYKQLKVKKTDKQRIEAFQKFCKKCKKNKTRIGIDGAYIFNNKLCATNTYMLIELNDINIICDKAEHLEKSPKYDFFGDYKTTHKTIDKIKNLKKEINYNYKIYKASKEKEKTIKNKGYFFINISNSDKKEYMIFNIEYLKIISDILDFEKSIIYVKNNINSLVIDNENGRGLLLPIRCDEFLLKQIYQIKNIKIENNNKLNNEKIPF